MKQAAEDAVLHFGWRAGTDLENSVALALTHCRALRAQQQYSVGRYRVDFAWPERKIALEADGWYHRSPEGAEKDRRRDSWLRSQGWVIFRVDDEHGEYLLIEQVRRVARIVGLHPELPKPPPKPRAQGCRAKVPDWDYEQHERPCKNKRRAGSEFCWIHRHG